jgi:hypothetical protein
MVSFVFGCTVEMEKVEEAVWVVAVSPTRLCPRLSRCQDPELERGLNKQPPSPNWSIYFISMHIRQVGFFMEEGLGLSCSISVVPLSLMEMDFPPISLAMNSLNSHF